MNRSFYQITLFTAIFFIQISSIRAEVLKLGVLAPEGTTWAKSINAIAEEMAQKTNNRVSLKVFYGGNQGDEPVVLRKIRAQQLQGGIFTGRVLGEVYGSTRLMEVPFTFFHNQEWASSTLKKMEGSF